MQRELCGVLAMVLTAGCGVLAGLDDYGAAPSGQSSGGSNGGGQSSGGSDGGGQSPGGSDGGGPVGILFEQRVPTNDDDVEEYIVDGYMYLDSSDLELGEDTSEIMGRQRIGLRFGPITVPRGSTIHSADLGFVVDEITAGATSVTISAQAADDALPFLFTPFHLSMRPRTQTSVMWDIPPWDNVGVEEVSPDLSPVVTEVVNRAGWVEGGFIVFIIHDALGRRIAVARDSSKDQAPRLRIDYTPPQGGGGGSQ